MREEPCGNNFYSWRLALLLACRLRSVTPTTLTSGSGPFRLSTVSRSLISQNRVSCLAGYKHTLVQHPHRYSHLRKFVYDPDVGSVFKFTGLTKRLPEQRLKFIHPISALGFRIQDIPDDLSLESRDCLSLYDAMKEVVGPERQAELAELDPLLFFNARANTFFRQKDVLEYEAALKTKLQQWMSAPGGSDPNASAQQVIALLSRSIKPASTDAAADFGMSKEAKQSELVKLLSDLHHQNDLVNPLVTFFTPY